MLQIHDGFVRYLIHPTSIPRPGGFSPLKPLIAPGILSVTAGSHSGSR